MNTLYIALLHGQTPRTYTTKLSKGEKDDVYYIIISPSIYAMNHFFSPQLSYWYFFIIVAIT